MKVTTILSITIFAAIIVGSPLSEYGSAKHIRRRAIHCRFKPSLNSTTQAIAAESTSPNWAGVDYPTPPDGVTYKTVTGGKCIRGVPSSSSTGIVVLMQNYSIARAAPATSDTGDRRVSFW
jgi:hypothetical protein